MVVALITTIASARAAVENRLFAALGATDARIVHLFNGRFESDLLEQVRTWPEVKQAVGSLYGSLTLIRADGARDLETGRLLRLTPRIYGVTPEAESVLHPVELRAGRYIEADGEIMVDQNTADALEVSVGGALEVQRFGEPIPLEVVGIYHRPVLGLIQRPEARVALSTLQEATDRTGEMTLVEIILHDRDRVDAFVERYRDEMPEQLALEPAVMIRSGFDRQVRAGNVMLTLGASLAFMCCAFIVLTGLSTGLTEQQRQMAVIRCLGGTRGQLFMGQVWLGLMIGSIAAITGIPLGIGFAWLVVWYFREFVPTGLTFSWMAVNFGLIGALGTGLIGAMFPAFLASRVAPLRAMASSARGARPAQLILISILGLAALGLQVALHQLPDATARFWAYALGGLPLIHIGYFMLGVPIFLLVTLLFAGVLTRLLRLPASLLRQTMFATPIRLGLTAGTLMVGVSILISTWANGTSLMSDWVARMRFADGFAFSRSGISHEQADIIRSLPFVTATCPIGYLPLEVKGQHVFGVEGLAPPQVVCVGFDPSTFFRMNQIEWTQGSIEEALPKLESGEGILVAEQFLTARNIGVGSMLTLGAGRLEREFEVVGVVSSSGLELATQYFGIRSVYYERAVSTVFADFDVIRETFDNDDIYLLQVNLIEGIDEEKVEKTIADAAPGVFFRSGRSVRESIDEIGYSLLNLYSTIGAAAMLLACLAVGNVLIANVAARSFEYGVIRAVGGHRFMLLRLILAEACLMAITAMILGTALGLHEAWMGVEMYRDLAGLVLQLRVPLTPMIMAWCIVLILTLLAALPAGLRVARAAPRELLAAGRAGV